MKSDITRLDPLTAFSGKSIGTEEFFNHIVEVLGIIIDRRPKGRLLKLER